jgi:hypothetical protein
MSREASLACSIIVDSVLATVSAKLRRFCYRSAHL